MTIESAPPNQAVLPTFFPPLRGAKNAPDLECLANTNERTRQFRIQSLTMLLIKNSRAAEACISALLSLAVAKSYGSLQQTIPNLFSLFLKVAREDRGRR
jgi:hypothetical protein